METGTNRCCIAAESLTDSKKMRWLGRREWDGERNAVNIAQISKSRCDIVRLPACSTDISWDAPRQSTIKWCTAFALDNSDFPPSEISLVTPRKFRSEERVNPRLLSEGVNNNSAQNKAQPCPCAHDIAKMATEFSEMLTKLLVHAQRSDGASPGANFLRFNPVQ